MQHSLHQIRVGCASGSEQRHVLTHDHGGEVAINKGWHIGREADTLREATARGRISPDLMKPISAEAASSISIPDSPLITACIAGPEPLSPTSSMSRRAS